MLKSLNNITNYFVLILDTNVCCRHRCKVERDQAPSRSKGRSWTAKQADQVIDKSEEFSPFVVCGKKHVWDKFFRSWHTRRSNYVFIHRSRALCLCCSVETICSVLCESKNEVKWVFREKSCTSSLYVKKIKNSVLFFRRRF